MTSIDRKYLKMKFVKDIQETNLQIFKPFYTNLKTQQIGGDKL